MRDFDDVAHGVATINLDSWESFGELISETLRNGLADSPVQDWVFRGHASDEYRLIASLDRNRADLEPDVRLSLYRSTLELLRGSGMLGELQGASDAGLGGILQHYGAPTRLLDWTRSPYVAAYFAFLEPTASDGDDPYESCAVWALDRKSTLWVAQEGVALMRADYAFNERARAQRGYFTHNMTLEPDLERIVTQYHQRKEGVSCVKITIPREDSGVALREMELMGIHAYALFPGVEGACRHAFFRSQVKLGLLQNGRRRGCETVDASNHAGLQDL